MPYPDIHSFPKCCPGAYKENMGQVIVKLLKHFESRVPDTESMRRVIELASTPQRWSAGHRLSDEIGRNRSPTKRAPGGLDLSAVGWQRTLEKLSCQAMYNCSGAGDPFDPSCPFFIAGAAINLAKALAMPPEKVSEILASCV